MYTNITNLNDPASDYTPVTLKIQANIDINPLVKKRTNWNKFRNISTQFSLNIKLKNLDYIDNAMYTLTKTLPK